MEPVACKRFVGIVAGLGLAIAAAAPARADSVRDASSFKVVAPGGRFVFVWIAPRPVEQDASGWIEEKLTEIREIRRTYSRTGMYRNDGSSEPLWTVGEFKGGVRPAADGIHWVSPSYHGWLREHKTPDPDSHAVSFHAEGRLLRSYRVGELIADVGSLPRSVSMFRWQKEAGFTGEFEYTITTLEDSTFVFDVRTGAILSESRPSAFARWSGRAKGWLAERVWWVVAGAAALALAAWLWRCWRKRTTGAVTPSA